MLTSFVVFFVCFFLCGVFVQEDHVEKALQKHFSKTLNDGVPMDELVPKLASALKISRTVASK
jgi:hypothetical protein